MVLRIVLILAGVACVAACGSGGGGGGRTSVAAAFYPLAYAAERVGGSDVDVENLTPPGAEPHDLELSPKTIADLQRADVVLYLGHGFQPAVDEAVKGAQGTLVDGLSGLRLRPSSEQEGPSADPHVWLDPLLFARVVERVGKVLGEPAGTERLVADLRALDADYRARLAHCVRNELVTSHSAFGYLAARYGLEQVSITGVEPEAEPTARQLAGVVAVVRRTHATTVFFETLVSPRLAQTVAREAGVRTAVLDPIEGLTPAEQDRGETYLSVMRQNLAALRRALSCR